MLFRYGSIAAEARATRTTPSPTVGSVEAPVLPPSTGGSTMPDEHDAQQMDPKRRLSVWQGGAAAIGRGAVRAAVRAARGVGEKVNLGLTRREARADE